nr:telomere repeat-binding factor 4-like [Tanacetum cinerariifolium]
MPIYESFTPTPISQVPGSSSTAIVLAHPALTDVITEDSLKCVLDKKTASKYVTCFFCYLNIFFVTSELYYVTWKMEIQSYLIVRGECDRLDLWKIFNILILLFRHDVATNSRRVLGGRLRRLLQQGKLEKVQNCYRLRSEALNGTRDQTLKPKEIRHKISPINCHLGETLEEAAVAAAYKVSEAENKSFVAAEAVKELERVTRMAEEAEAFLQLAQQIYERCATGEVVKVQ